MLDIDIKGFFDTIDHELLLRALRRHNHDAWVRLYIERWLKAPVMSDGGELGARERDTPPGSHRLGGVISRHCWPICSCIMPSTPATLGLNAAGDARRAVRAVGLRHHLPLPERRGGTSALGAARSPPPELRFGASSAEDQAGLLPKLLQGRDTNRKEEFDCVRFDFLGYRFQPRLAKSCCGLFGVSFLPAARPEALVAIRRRVRRWGLQWCRDKSLFDLARMFEPYIRGRIGYFSHFYKSALYQTLRLIDVHLVRWVQRKYKRFRARPRGARAWLASIIRAYPDLFVHWRLIHGSGRTLGAV